MRVPVPTRTPETVVLDPELSTQEKIDLLERWMYDERQIAVAVQEGMPGPEPELFARVLDALISVKGDS